MLFLVRILLSALNLLFGGGGGGVGGGALGL